MEDLISKPFEDFIEKYSNDTKLKNEIANRRLESVYVVYGLNVVMS